MRQVTGMSECNLIQLTVSKYELTFDTTWDTAIDGTNATLLKRQ